MGLFSDMTIPHSSNHDTTRSIQVNGAKCTDSKKLAGDRLVSKLFFALMLISELAGVSVFWLAVKTIPGLFECVGYLFGISVAYFAFDALFRHRQGQM